MGQDTFFIGEIAERSGVTRDTIRYYEAVGVLPEASRTASGYRLYGPDDVARIEFIGQAQALGLSLEEIAEVLEIVDRGQEPCVHVRARLAARLDETRDRIGRLQALERRLKQTLARASDRGSRGSEACHCRIIESGDPDAPARGGRARSDDGLSRAGG